MASNGDGAGMEEMKSKLGSAGSFDEVFDMVKRSAEKVLGMHRAGLSLVLGDVPNVIGAFYQMGGNAIVLNRNILNAIAALYSSPGKPLAGRAKAKLNAYVFSVLLHEYIHSLGYGGDADTRRMTRRVCAETFGEDHMSAKLAYEPLDKVFPGIMPFLAFHDKKGYEQVGKFDRSSAPYIA